jgi:heme-degrading monooxygenase HmoA
MSYLLIHHKVQNFDNWKKAYDDHRGARDQAGLAELHLLRSVADRNDVVILFKADDLERARAFVRSDDLRKAMQGAGVVGVPELLELE